MTNRYVLGSSKLCYDVNPALWNVFCALTNRPLGTPNYLWTEQAVIDVMLSRGLAKHEYAEIDSTYVQLRANQ